MEKEFLKLVRCVYCNQQFEIYRRINKSIIFTCSCQKYPFINRILYLKHDKARKQATAYLLQGKEKKALLSLLNVRFLLKLPLAVLILLSDFSKLVTKLTKKHFYQLLGFEKTVSLLTFFYYEKSESRYLKKRRRIPSYFFSLFAANLIKDNSTRVVDIGCGVGHLLPILSQKSNSKNVFGIDQSFINLFLARTFFSPSTFLICVDVENGLPFVDESLDIVLATDSFHYIKTKRFFLQEVARITKFNGKVAVSHTLNAPDNNIKGLSPNSLSKLLQQTGFNQISIYSNLSLWRSLSQNIPVRLDQSDSHQILKRCQAYSTFASKIQLPRTVQLTAKQHKLLKKTNIEYKKDPELLSEMRLQELTTQYSQFIFLSPHLDDAVLSCGFLLEHLLEMQIKNVSHYFFYPSIRISLY